MGTTGKSAKLLLVALSCLFCCACVTQDEPALNSPKSVRLDVRSGTVVLKILKTSVNRDRDAYNENASAFYPNNKPDNAKPDNNTADSQQAPVAQSVTLRTGEVYSNSLDDSESISIQIKTVGGEDAIIQYSENDIGKTYVISTTNLLGLYLSSSN